MRIVIDMQGAQTESRFRGIGRYTLSFAQAVVKHRGDHEVILALSGMFPDAIAAIRAAFDGLLPQANIRVWNAPGPVSAQHADNVKRREMAESIREAFLASLQPDIVHITSLFEGYLDDGVTSIECIEGAAPVTVGWYEHTPLLTPDERLSPSSEYADYFERKRLALQRASGILAASEHSYQEALYALGPDTDKVVHVGSGRGGTLRATDSATSAAVRHAPLEARGMQHLDIRWPSPVNPYTHSLEGPQEHCHFSWGDAAKRAIAAWEKIQHRSASTLALPRAANAKRKRLVNTIAPYLIDADEDTIHELASHLARNESSGIERQLLVDVSALCQHETTAENPSLAFGFLLQLLRSPPAGFRVEPVYATATSGYRYASSHTEKWLQQPATLALDPPIQWQRGDLFFGLDPELCVQVAHSHTFALMRQHGVIVKFLLPDSLFEQPGKPSQDSDDTNNTETLREPWLALVAQQHGAIGISKAASKNYRAWLDQRAFTPSPHFQLEGLSLDAGSRHTAFETVLHALEEQDQQHPHQLAESLATREGNTEKNNSTLYEWNGQKGIQQLQAALIGRHYPRRQLLVDVSALAHQDIRTGIQRVVRSILKEWLTHPPAGFTIEPVFATFEQPYKYARRFTASFLNFPTENLVDEKIEYQPGDIFFVLDLNHHVPVVHQDYLNTMYNSGVDVRFMVYDLLPIQFPQFWDATHFVHLAVEKWMRVVATLGGVVCISKIVADDFSNWMQQEGIQRSRKFNITWFHLGADTANSVPSTGMPVNAESVLFKLKSHPSFLMVSTLEPRKGHEQVLDAFERLWLQGSEIVLTIVGKQGWMVEGLVERIRRHPELDKKLFWLEGVSDEYLEKIYDASTCLIAASHGEGFGLPLIEAAQHQLPILARDIPITREVAGEHAAYFTGSQPEDIEQALAHWLNLKASGDEPKSKHIPWLTWSQSAKHLLNALEVNENENPQSRRDSR